MRRTGRNLLIAVAAASVLPGLGVPQAATVRAGTVLASTVRASTAGDGTATAGKVSAPARRLGTISIPKLKVRQPILSGVSLPVFDHGIGHWPGTALPGQAGNMVLGGHRTSAMRPFYDIQKLAVGDPIIVTRSGRTYTYVVSGSKIVKPTATWILRQTPDSTLTLFSCHPRGSVRQRYVVTATLRP